ncbi:MAG TPA: zinc-binding dehydrogenase [bacterium]|nr:zinc-binding dehydrogenase [bacterium]
MNSGRGDRQRQAVLVGPRRFAVEEGTLRRLGPREVRVRVAICGVCASELPQWKAGPGDGRSELGHEVSGEIVEVGSAVTTVAPGTAVTGLLKPGFSEYATASDDRVASIPPGLNVRDALGEPLACIVSAAARTRVELGDTVAIVGLGFMGLLMLQAIRLRGPSRIVAIDVRRDALTMAQRLGAHEVFTPDQLPDRLRVRQRSTMEPGWGVDVAIEASGTQPGLTLAGELVREHGQLSILGYHNEGGGRREVDMQLWNWKALDVLNAHDRRVDVKMECVRRGLRLMAAGQIDVGALISHRFSLDEVDAAFSALETKVAGFCKAVVELSQ